MKTDTSKVMVLGVKEDSVCNVTGDSEEFGRVMVSGKKVMGVVKSLANPKRKGVKQWCGEIIKDLELGLYRWIT